MGKDGEVGGTTLDGVVAVEEGGRRYGQPVRVD